MEQSLKRKNIIKAAKLYYYGNMSQDQIATLMEISRPKVSRMLTVARQLNIVQIKINDPISSNVENAEKIRRHFLLKEVIIVSPGNNAAEAKDNIGRAASDLLNKNLHDNIKIGIAWGTTLNSFVRLFNTTASLPKAQVVQLVGGTYSQTMNMDGRELVKTLATKLHCNFNLLQAPLIVHNPSLRDLLMEEPEVLEHFRFIANLDIAFVGVGSSNYKESVVFKAKYIKESEAKELAQMGLVCDICGHQLNADGKEPTTFLSDRIVGATIKDIARVPIVVGLGAGHEKAVPILAGIRGGCLNTLIIDEIAAISIIEAEKIQ